MTLFRLPSMAMSIISMAMLVQSNPLSRALQIRIDTSNTCTFSKPCGLCAGICTYDADCAPGLSCMEVGVGEEVSGCLGVVTVANAKICYAAETTLYERTTAIGCTEGDPCSLCEGTCNKNSQCAGGLSCFLRSGTEPVPGCDATGVSGAGYCYAPSNQMNIVATLDCTATSPCGLCHGDCDNNNECADNLICFQRDGLTPVPGCHGLGKSGADYCINPQSELLHTGQCSPTSRCDICKGACNTNADCVGNLSCFKRIANEPVPNCFGSGVTGVGYCYAAPNATLSNTPGSDDCAVVPCGLCQGDCDNDKECRPGLMCLQRDANEVIPGCSMTGAVSGRDYCIAYPNTLKSTSKNATSIGLCSGNCLATGASCASGLKCFKGDGTSQVPGCSGVSTLNVGYCYEPTESLDVVPVCSPSNPCHLCEGNCKVNDECDAALECFTRKGTESVPGCKGIGVTGVGYCHAPSSNLIDNGDCDTNRTCGLCQGDCDADNQCADGLWCFMRDGLETIPGCSGTGRSGTDYCYAPQLCYKDGFPWNTPGQFGIRCSFQELTDYANELEGGTLFASGTCHNTAKRELTLLLGFDNEADAEAQVKKFCDVAYKKWNADGMPFPDILDKGEMFDKEFFDGNTVLNDERETIVEYGTILHELDEEFVRLATIRNQKADAMVIQWPSYMSNFQNCSLQAAMCCWVQDRQANDNNGNCAEPYDQNCVNANPADNTDICYVDMPRSPGSNHVNGGFAIYSDNAEDDAHCHGMVWSKDDHYENNIYKGNDLFFISLFDHFHQRGYIREVPGAPMCACLEQMPVVSRSDCTEIDATETVEFSFDMESREFTFNILAANVSFSACRAAQNNDLAAYYDKLLSEGRVTQAQKAAFDKIIVGNNNCGAAITSFLGTKGISAATQA